jgi:hypothetical protein
MSPDCIGLIEKISLQKLDPLKRLLDPKIDYPLEIITQHHRLKV